MRRFVSLGGVLFLIVAAIFFFDTIGFYLWARVPTAQALRDGKPAPEIALYQRDGKLVVQDGLYCYLIGHQFGKVGWTPRHNFSQFHRNYLHCRYILPLTIDMNSSKVEIDPRLEWSDNHLAFTNMKHQRVNINWYAH